MAALLLAASVTGAFAAPIPAVSDSVALAMHHGRYRIAMRMLAARSSDTADPVDRIRVALCHLHLDQPDIADSLLAIAAYDDYQQIYVDYWRAYAAHRMGNPAEAARRFDLLADNARSPISDSAGVWALRSALVADDDLLVGKAVDRLVRRDDDEAAFGLLVRMRSRTPDWEASWDRLRTQHQSVSAALHGAYLADSLGWTPEGEEWIELARLYEQQNDVPEAVRAWRGAIDSELPSERIVYARYYLAKLLVNNRDYSPGSAQLQAILSDDGAANWHPASLRLLAKLERRRDRETRSREIERQFQTRFPSHEDVAESMWQIAMSLERTRNLDAAMEEHERLANRFPGRELADEARWRIGLIHYRQGHYRRAQRQFARLAEDTQHWLIHDQAAFWAGKALYADGRYDEANRMWDRAAAYSPRSYYAVVSALVSNRPITPPEDEKPVSVDPTREPEDWPGFQEAAWLASVGEWRWAREVFSLRTRGLARKVTEREELADAYEAIGDYYMSLRWRWRAMWGRITEDRYHELTPDQLRRIWPDFFSPQVTAAAKRHNIDPALLWAVIRQESVFDPDATSFADARGLMQIIPTTGRALARQMQIDEFDAMDLYDPALNIQLGAQYVQQLLRQFDNKVDYMASGYNAGPSNVSRWRRAAPEDHDLYREMITYSETRKYVKLVLKNYLIYRALYPDRHESDGGS